MTTPTWKIVHGEKGERQEVRFHTQAVAKEWAADRELINPELWRLHRPIKRGKWMKYPPRPWLRGIHQ